MNAREMLDEVKLFLGVSTDSELSRIIGASRSSINRLSNKKEQDIQGKIIQAILIKVQKNGNNQDSE